MNLLPPLPFLPELLIFAASSVLIWFAGIYLSNYTDVLSDRLHLGQALGGLILLAVATNLPELAITYSAAASGQLTSRSATSWAASHCRPSSWSRWTRAGSGSAAR